MILFGIVAAGTTLGLTAEAKLKVGDHAPKLQTGKWVQGDPVKDFEKDKAYIVEFWATWCGPCRASIPHLNEVYQKYKDKGLVVIGQNCWEQDESKVVPFVKQMGDKMTYRVALDDKDGSEKGKMAETWMAAAGRNGIPSAFLVDKQGLIAWIGHPMQLQEKVIDQVLEGTFDVRKAAVLFEQEQKNETLMRTVWASINQASKDKDWTDAEAKIAEAEKAIPEDQREALDMARLSVLFGKEDYPAAYKLLTSLSDAHKDDAMLQNQWAWQILTSPDIKQRDLKVAELCANRANEAAKGKDANVLDTIARLKFMQGEKAEAVATQEKAISLAEGGQKAQFEKTLESYKRGELSKAD
jgi:thiol-disulfide isomerase/thioredoxin